MPRALAGQLLLLALVACGSAPRQARPAARGDLLAPESAAARDAVLHDDGEPLDEASARRLLAAQFRASGLRIVEDVPLEEGGVTLVADGFDPARRVGYEYIAAEEKGLELDAGERAQVAALPGVRLLVAEEATAGALERAAATFLAELPR